MSGIFHVTWGKQEVEINHLIQEKLISYFIELILGRASYQLEWRTCFS